MTTGPAWRRFLAWAGAHKARTALLLLGAFLLYELLTIPWFGVADLATENPKQTALMRQRIREAEAKGKTLAIRQKWVPLARISRSLQRAVVVAEDGTFFEHGGIDWFEVRASFAKNWEKKRFARGASTITQQLAKNLYLSTSKDPLRKAKEVVITLLLERHLTKNRILELYLNIIEWGPGVFGAEAAAGSYFGKSAAGLSPSEAARMAAVIPSPLRHRPNDGSRYTARRAAIIGRRLVGRGEGGRAETDELRTIEEEEPPEESPAERPGPASTEDSAAAPRSEEPPPQEAAPDGTDTSTTKGSDELQGR
jgi:monofunctional biosynthetic peptidoglycan transglycosylase